MNIENTSLNPSPEWLFGGNPTAIENQEAEGQKLLCQSSQLPVDVRGRDALETYKSLGIKVIRPSKGDKLFYDVILPSGFKIEPTEHAMHSDLINAEGKKVGSIFYKAAFYDRKAIFALVEKEQK